MICWSGYFRLSYENSLALISRAFVLLYLTDKKPIGLFEEAKSEGKRAVCSVFYSDGEN